MKKLFNLILLLTLTLTINIFSLFLFEDNGYVDLIIHYKQNYDQGSHDLANGSNHDALDYFDKAQDALTIIENDLKTESDEITLEVLKSLNFDSDSVEHLSSDLALTIEHLKNVIAQAEQPVKPPTVTPTPEQPQRDARIAKDITLLEKLVNNLVQLSGDTNYMPTLLNPKSYVTNNYKKVIENLKNNFDTLEQESYEANADNSILARRIVALVEVAISLTPERQTGKLSSSAISNLTGKTSTQAIDAFFSGYNAI